MGIKKYLPFEKFTLTTKLSATELHNRLSKNVGFNSAFSDLFYKSGPEMPYFGKVEAENFKIRRNIRYRNSFLPVISGQVSSFAGKTTIDIKMRLSIYAIVFVSVWLGGVSLFCIGALVLSFMRSQVVFLPMIGISFAMLIFGCQLTSYGFKKESKISKEFLADLLEVRQPGLYDQY
jgi:hypothetical protein